MKRIAILETGRPPKALQALHGDYADMFETLLGEGFQTTRFDVAAGALPDPAQFDGAILTGSAAAVYEPHAWMEPLFDWIRNAYGRTRLVGICFGHQAIAQALGGRVEKADNGWGVGLHQYAVLSRQPWMGDDTAEIVALPASHQDQVVQIPAGARVFLRNAFTPNAGLVWGKDILSIQAHPEFSTGYTEALIAGRTEVIKSVLAKAAIASLSRPNDCRIVGRWIQRFLKA